MISRTVLSDMPAFTSLITSSLVIAGCVAWAAVDAMLPITCCGAGGGTGAAWVVCAAAGTRLGRRQPHNTTVKPNGWKRIMFPFSLIRMCVRPSLTSDIRCAVYSLPTSPILNCAGWVRRPHNDFRFHESQNARERLIISREFLAGRLDTARKASNARQLRATLKGLGSADS